MERPRTLAERVKYALAHQAAKPVDQLVDATPLIDIWHPAHGLGRLEAKFAKILGIKAIDLSEHLLFDWKNRSLAGLIKLLEIVNRVANVIVAQTSTVPGTLKKDIGTGQGLTTHCFDVTELRPLVRGLQTEFGIRRFPKEVLDTVGSVIRYVFRRQQEMFVELVDILQLVLDDDTVDWSSIAEATKITGLGTDDMNTECSVLSAGDTRTVCIVLATDAMLDFIFRAERNWKVRLDGSPHESAGDRRDFDRTIDRQN